MQDSVTLRSSGLRPAALVGYFATAARRAEAAQLQTLGCELLPNLIESTIPGAEQLIAWFGAWPTFHDAEVLELSLRREGKSCVRVHAWRITAAIDSTGHFGRDHHVIVTFWFEDILDLGLADFSGQNVIYGLTCEKTERGFKVTMVPCFGVNGYVEAERISVSFEPADAKQ